MTANAPAVCDAIVRLGVVDPGGYETAFTTDGDGLLSEIGTAWLACKSSRRRPGERCRRNAKYQAIPELKEALALLEKEKFHKMIAFLRSPLARRVRTNNHVERCNRKLRYWEKVRYKWRRRRSLVRFLVLALDHWWKKVLPKTRSRAGKKDGEGGDTMNSGKRAEEKMPSRRKAA